MSKLWEVYVYAVENCQSDAMVQLPVKTLAMLLEYCEYSVAKMICDEHKDAGIDHARYAVTEDYRDCEANELPSGLCRFIPSGSESISDEIKDCTINSISDRTQVIKKRDCRLVALKRIDEPEKETSHANLHWGNS
jgi:hypothetical protein